MVRIIGFRKAQNKEGKDFISLTVQGGVIAIQSQQTGRMYLTAQTASVSCTFDEDTAKALIGTSIAGKVARVASEPYDYTIKDTNEVVTLSHRFEYMPDDIPAPNYHAEEHEEAPQEENFM